MSDMNHTELADTLAGDVQRAANEFAPRRQRADRKGPPANPEQRPAPEPHPTVVHQQVLTPNALRIATQLDTMERERLAAVQERDAALARIEQFENRQTELLREKQALETKLEDSQRATELERNERIRLSNVIESAIQLFQQKLPMPDPDSRGETAT